MTGVIKYVLLILLIALLAGAFYIVSQNQIEYGALFDKKVAEEERVEVSKNLVSEPPMPEPSLTRPEPPIPTTKEPKTSTESKPKILSKNELVIVCPDGSTFDRFRCFKDFYEKMVKDKGIKPALEDIKTRYNDPFVKSQCHQLTHVIGRVALEIYPSVTAAFREGDSFCWSGYYHGITEAIVANSDRDELLKKIDYVCSEIPGKGKYSFDYYNCVHGLGHGFMAVAHDELPESLKLCENLSGSWEKQSCWSGAFMENIIADQVNHFSKYLKNDDPLYPCTAVDDKYKGICYLMQTSHALKVVNWDFTKVFELCSTIGDYENTCYQSLGRDASGNSVSNIGTTRERCLLGKDYRQQSNCIVGAAKDFVSYYHSNKEAEILCASLPEDLQTICFETVESYYKVF